MIFSAISIFPEIFDFITNFGITKYAFTHKICQLNRFNPRDFTTDPHHKVDDKSFGGGPGMVMKVEPLELAMAAAISSQQNIGVENPLKVCLSPQGTTVNQDLITSLSKESGIIFVCGRYEGVDERFMQNNIDLELSVGDFVVSGGELPAMLVMDGIIRHLPGVLNSQESAINDSFMNGLLDYPHYTQPRVYRGVEVPEVLLSGNHKKIELWRLQMSLWNTYKKRPDLLEKRTITNIESRLLEEMQSRNKIKGNKK